MVRKILDGQVFGEWTVLGYAGDKKQLCQCSCGEVREVSTYSLTSGKSTNCGNKAKHPKDGKKRFKDLTNQVFGELKAIEYVGDTYWNCTCPKGHITKCSWKHLASNSTCRLCRYEAMRKPKEPKPEKVDKMIGMKVNDLTVIKRVGPDRYQCRCKCGFIKEVRGHSLRNPRLPTSYVCRHKVEIGQRFGKLVLEERLRDGWCRCTCDCGNESIVHVGNLLNGTTTSCGCNKAPRYSKEEVIERIRKFTEETGEKPFAKELAPMLDLGMTAIYEYVDNYGLRPLLNSKFDSKAEKDIYLMLKDRFPNTELHNRKLLGNLELDIYIPEIKTAIEFNGTYWHKYPTKDKNYHQNKTLQCLKGGIRLIHIFEYEWEDDTSRKKIESLINSLTGNVEVLYARNLHIKELDNSIAYEFEIRNHLQGRGNSSINIGLVDDNNELVGVMTFGEPRFDATYQYELIRLCYKLNHIIVGGSEKMFKYFVERYSPESILTYSNISKFTGDVYSKLGFKNPVVNSITQPGYVWVNEHGYMLTRYQTMKKDLIAKGYGTSDMTEDEIMTMRGYYKMYDSGNIKYEYIRG